MGMSKKDYELIAAACAHGLADLDEMHAGDPVRKQASNGGGEHVVVHVMNALAADNRRFDRKRFAQRVSDLKDEYMDERALKAFAAMKRLRDTA